MSDFNRSLVAPEAARGSTCAGAAFGSTLAGATGGSTRAGAAVGLALAMAALGLTLATPARAQEADDVESGPSRGHHAAPESAQHFAFELRFGPYRPDVDSAFAPPGPYQTVFGDSRPFFLGAEFDWQVLRIPMVGTIGPGFGIGYSSSSGVAKISNTVFDSSEETTLKIMPMYAVAVARVDVLARETVIPFVPYLKAGLGYGLWWAGNDLGNSGKGRSIGTHFALGGMLLLDGFDENASLQLDNDMGINNSYLFFEWLVSNLDGFGSSTTMRIGTNTWVLGLALEM